MTFIVAEAGSNWNTLEDCYNSIGLAKQCGADAVKFQMFSFEELYGMDCSKASARGLGPNPCTPCNNALDPEWLPLLKQKADSVGIEFMCTAFSPEGLREVDKYVDRHKIASSDLSYVELLRSAASTGKPIILSTGASSISDIRLALTVLNANDRVTILYCSSAYPARYSDLRHIDYLRKEFGVPIGLSDHTLDVINTPHIACMFRDVSILEKHVNFCGIESPDSPHSLSTDEFKHMCSVAREINGKDDFYPLMPNPEEKDMLLRHNRRLIALIDLKPGDKLSYGENFGAYRVLKDDTEGMTPFLSDKINGREIKKEIKAYEPLTPQHL